MMSCLCFDFDSIEQVNYFLICKHKSRSRDAYNVQFEVASKQLYNLYHIIYNILCNCQSLKVYQRFSEAALEIAVHNDRNLRSKFRTRLSARQKPIL